MEPQLTLEEDEPEASALEAKALVPFTSFVLAMFDLWEPLRDPETGLQAKVEELTVGLPCEMSVEVDDEGVLAIAGAPPLLRTETSIMPVFHQIRIHLAIDQNES
ncbi:MAG: hypothetical protein ACREOI_07990 [bacterium]